MHPLDLAVADFLAQRRLAVAGVSRDPRQPANAIFRRLREAGYTVYPVNPNAESVEGETCYPDLASMPELPDGVVAVTPPEATLALAHECVALGIPRLWMHRGIGPGSVSDEAVAVCREHGITAIPGVCPMMFVGPVDVVHRCAIGCKRLTGRLPEPVGIPGATAA